MRITRLPDGMPVLRVAGRTSLNPFGLHYSFNDIRRIIISSMKGGEEDSSVVRSVRSES